MAPIPKPLVLVILDGWGYTSTKTPGNAISEAQTPNLDKLYAEYPHTLLDASGEAVGLPHGEAGNTETGHLNIGAGRVVLQDLPRINMSIADGSYFENDAFIKAVEHVHDNQSTFHILGLLGAGGVHSNLEHIFALLHLAKENNVKRLAFHVITDGRDSPPTSALTYIGQLNEKIKTTKIGKISSISGRYYAMDRDHRWERTEKSYRTLTSGDGKIASTPEQAVNQSYRSGKTDEFIEPTIIVGSHDEQPVLIRENDSVIFANFRIDRPRQLTKAFVLPNFEDSANRKPGFDPYAVKYYKKHEVDTETQTKPFSRGDRIKNLFFVTMTEYERGLPVSVAFPPQPIQTPLGQVLAKKSLKQLRIAETEKERFVTYYFNGLREDPFPGEDLIIIPSPKVSTYDQQPQMSAPEITEAVLERVGEGLYDVMIINFANPDMVAHTGNLKATIDACQVVDGSVGQIVEKTLTVNGALIITADHGNAEQLLNPDSGAIITEHSSNPVPLILVSKQYHKSTKLPQGVLADIAPTMLQMLKISKPKEMTGRSLI